MDAMASLDETTGHLTNLIPIVVSSGESVSGLESTGLAVGDEDASPTGTTNTKRA